MRALVYGLALFLLGTSAVLASPAKDGSIEKLMAVTHARRLTENVSKQFDTMMDSSVRRAVIDKMPLLMRKTISYTQRMIRESSPQMRQIIDQFRADMKAASD